MPERMVIDQRTDRSVPPSRLVVFFHGFMTMPSAYRALLTAVSGTDTVVVAPRMYRPGPSLLAGRPTAIQEAASGATIVDELAAAYAPGELWIAGHSRGGQVAWRIASQRAVDGVVLIDPVDGSGPKEMRPTSTAAPATFSCRTLVIGAGRAGRCAPEAVNHELFAAAGPPGTVHLVVVGLGHADMLDGRARTAARALCPGHDDPDAARETVAALMRNFLVGELRVDGQTPLAVERR